MGKIRFWIVMLIVLVAALLSVRVQMLQVRKNQAQIRKMELYLDNMDEEVQERQKNLARWYNYRLSQGEQVSREVYENILNFGDGVMAVLEVPELHLRLPVFHGENEIAGHLPDSALPIGGRDSHTILTVNRWMPWVEGMTVYIECLGSRNAYRVESIQVMPEGWTAEWPSDRDRLTVLHDSGGRRTIIRCVRCGELSMQRSERWSGSGTVLCLLLLKISFNWFRWSLRGRKYTGFIPEILRKSKILRNYSCKILENDV